MIYINSLTEKDRDTLHRFQRERHPELPLKRLSLSNEDMEALTQWYRIIISLYFLETYGFKVSVM